MLYIIFYRFSFSAFDRNKTQFIYDRNPRYMLLYLRYGDGDIVVYIVLVVIRAIQCGYN